LYSDIRYGENLSINRAFDVYIIAILCAFTFGHYWFANRFFCFIYYNTFIEHLVLQYLPTQTTEHVDIATGADAKLYRQLVGRAHSGHAAAAAFGRENRTELRKRRIWQRITGIGTCTTTVARAPAALGRVAGHTEGHGKSKFAF